MKKFNTYIILGLLFLAIMSFTVSASSEKTFEKHENRQIIGSNLDTNHSNETRSFYKHGDGWVSGYGFGNGSLDGYGIIGLTKFTGLFNHYMTPTILNYTAGCKQRGNNTNNTYDCINANVSAIAVKNPIFFSFYGNGNFYAKGKGSAWFTGIGELFWGRN